MNVKYLIYTIVLLVLPIFLLAQKGLINNGMHIVVEGNHSIILEDDMEIVNNNGTIELDGMMQVASDITNNSTESKLFKNTNNIGTLVLNGASGQTLAGSNTIALDNLEINSAGIQLATHIEQNGNLLFNAGSIALNDYNYLLGATSSLSGTFSSDNMFSLNGIGEVRKHFSSIGTFTFPLGEETGTIEYSPGTINVTYISANTDAYIGLSVTDQKFYRNSSTSEFLSRFWTVTGSGISNINYNASFFYTEDDVEGNEAAIYSTFYNDDARVNYSLVNATANQIEAENLTEFGVFTGADGASDIAELNASMITVFPNPANAMVTVHYPEYFANDVQVDVINAQGIAVNNQGIEIVENGSPGSLEIHLNEMANGMYYIRFLSKEKLVIKKLIVQN